MPRKPNIATYKMADAVDKIIDLQTGINRDIDTLVDLMRDIVAIIKRIDNTEYQALLEKRYLCFSTWEQIAVDMNYSLRWLYIVHGRALQAVEAIIKGKR